MKIKIYSGGIKLSGLAASPHIYRQNPKELRFAKDLAKSGGSIQPTLSITSDLVCTMLITLVYK